MALRHFGPFRIGFVSIIYFFARTPIPTDRIEYTSPLFIMSPQYTAELSFWRDLVLFLEGRGDPPFPGKCFRAHLVTLLIPNGVEMAYDDRVQMSSCSR
jgi:hypothetical protein